MKLHNNDISVSVFAFTDVGRHRTANEDAFLIADLTTGKEGLSPDMAQHAIGERGSLLIVSDGLGGAAAGEIASELAVKTVRQSLLDMPTDLDAEARLKMATEVANETIWNEGQRHAALAGMGATVTAALVEGAFTHIAQVGDSRAYMIRGQQIKQLTKDQSYAQMLVDSGVITPDQMDTVPKHVISQALGIQPAIHVALTSIQICRQDYLILCSDGLSGKIHAEEMKSVVFESSDLGSACRRLVAIANERGGEDNITVVIASFDGSGLETAQMGKTITDSFQAVGQRRATPRRDSGTIPLTSDGPTPIPLVPGASVVSRDSAQLRELDPPPAATARLSQPESMPMTQPLSSGENPFPVNLEIPLGQPAAPKPEAKRSMIKISILLGLVIFLLLLFLTMAFMVYKLAF